MADNKTNEYDPHPSGEGSGEKCGQHGHSDYTQQGEQPHGYWQPPPPGYQTQPPGYPPAPEYPQPPTGEQPQGYPTSPEPPTGYPTPPPGQGGMPSGYPPPPPQGYPPPPSGEQPPTGGYPPSGYQPPPGQGYPPPAGGYPPPRPEEPPAGQGYPPTGGYPPPRPEEPPPGQGYPPTGGYPPPPPEYPTGEQPPQYPTQPPGQGYPTPPGQGYPTPPGQGYPTPPGQGYPTPPGQGYPTGQKPYPQGPDPQERLNKLKKELAHAKAEKDRFTDLEQKLTEDVTASEQVGQELDQILAAYEQALPNLIKGQKDAQTYSDTKMRMILCAIEKKKPEIDHKIAQYYRQISDKTAAVEQLKAKKKAAEEAVKQAQDEKKKKDEQYTYWKDLQSNTEKNLEEIAALKTQIEAEDEKSHAASMYFLALELQGVLKTIKTVSKDQLKYYLLTALTERDKANQTLRQRETELSQATSALNTEQTELDQLKEKRRENILKIMATCDEPPEQQQKKSQAAK